MASVQTYVFTPLLSLINRALEVPYVNRGTSTQPGHPTIPQDYQLKAGVLTSLILTTVTLPSRLDEGQGRDWSNLLGSQLLLWVLGVSCWLINQYWFGQRRIGSTRWKVLLSLVICALLSAVFYLVLTVFVAGYPSTGGLLRLTYQGILMGGLLYAVISYLHMQQTFHRLRPGVQPVNQPEAVNAIQYLHQQLDAHFLFNSLNILHAGAQQRWVRNYVLQLSQVYRYFLQNDQGTEQVTLTQEMDFVRSYIHILRERFEAGLQVTIRVEPEAETLVLPALALQILIENAVKHNIVSLKRPLRIDIFTHEKELVVRNVLQRKLNSSLMTRESLGIGLKNLAERYRMLVRKTITIQEDSGYFTVRLPLSCSIPNERRQLAERKVVDPNRQSTVAV